MDHQAGSGTLLWLDYGTIVYLRFSWLGIVFFFGAITILADLSGHLCFKIVLLWAIMMILDIRIRIRISYSYSFLSCQDGLLSCHGKTDYGSAFAKKMVYYPIMENVMLKYKIEHIIDSIFMPLGDVEASQTMTPIHWWAGGGGIGSDSVWLLLCNSILTIYPSLIVTLSIAICLNKSPPRESLCYLLCDM